LVIKKILKKIENYFIMKNNFMKMIYIIYKIKCLETDETYFGKTKRTMKERMTKHKSIHNNTTSKCIINRNNYEVTELETCDNEEDSIEIESYYIRNFECVNCIIPNRTKSQYHIDNKEKRNKKSREYHLKNKEKYNKIYREYHQNNKEKRNKYDREYYYDNKEYKKYRQWWTRSYFLGILARNYFN
tara:strand:+ start:53 stop:613 length:561 start_codon:yes stop_codon:yes gene_type:complete